MEHQVNCIQNAKHKMPYLVHSLVSKYLCSSDSCTHMQQRGHTIEMKKFILINNSLVFTLLKINYFIDIIHRVVSFSVQLSKIVIIFYCKNVELIWKRCKTNY